MENSVLFVFKGRPVGVEAPPPRAERKWLLFLQVAVVPIEGCRSAVVAEIMQFLQLCFFLAHRTTDAFQLTKSLR